MKGTLILTPFVWLMEMTSKNSDPPRRQEFDESDRPKRRRNHTREKRDDVKVDVPDFDGKAQEDAFMEWLLTVERIFKFKDYSEEKKVKIAAIKFKGCASLWWDNLKREREREGRGKIRTWEKMKRELRRRFLPDMYKQANYLKFRNFRQGDQTVEDYTREFEYLMIKCDAPEPEEQTIARYISGLRRAISDVIRLQPYWTFNDV
ncbi:uncharacterized protein LOC142176418 [Nicotiana tabacum]|uniref:Uncharacterized protein LOC142176418 n=1 Tax=Nicotiana tabacum TaxID=4097 RepID=A0AC58TSG0_TOBAC